MNDKIKNFFFQDLGILGFLISVLISAVMIATAPESFQMQYIVMFFAMFAPVLLAAFKIKYVAIVLSAFQIIVYTIYQLFQVFVFFETLIWSSFVWILIPIAATASMILFMDTHSKMEMANRMLREQVEELVMIEPLTGLYNLKSMYHDLERQIAYCNRNKLELTLMIAGLRHWQELKQILSKSQYAAVKQRVAVIVEDNVRLEDKIYAIDNKGSVGIILTSDFSGAKIVAQRLRAAVASKAAFDRIADRPLKVEIKIGFLEYEKGEIASAMEFKQKVEKELQYDV